MSLDCAETIVARHVTVAPKSPRSPKLALAAGLLVCLLPPDTRAQSMDYGALEQVFGEPVTTAATGKPQRASDVPADMVIITADDIRRSGAASIPEILQFVTGIDVRVYSFADAQVAVRGYDSPLNPRLLVLVDGREVYNNVFGFVAWNTIPVQLSEIRQIEVVKGPNSALFGFNAVSGVINIVTYDPLRDSTNVATLRGGTQGYGQGELIATQHFGSTAGVRLSAAGWTASGYSQPDGAQPDPPRYASFNADGRWQILPWLLLNASGGYTDTHTERPLPIELLQDFRDHLSFWRIGAAAQTSAGTIDADVYENTDLQNPNGQQENRLLLAKLSDLLKPDPDTTLRAGIELRNNAAYAAPVYGGKISYTDFAANFMWDWQISPMFELTNAARIDHLALSQSGLLLPIAGRGAGAFNRATITQPSFNSGLVIHLSDQDTLRLTAARGLQVPSLVDFGLQLAVAPGTYLLGTPSARPESVWNTELSYDRSLDAFNATAHAALYFQRNTDILAPPGAAPYLPFADVVASATQTIGSSNEIGLELGLKGTTPSGYRWNASYRYTSISQDETAGVAQSQATGFDHGTPAHVVILGAGRTVGRWGFDLQARFQTRFTDYAQNEAGAVVPVVVPAYVTANARIAYRLTPSLMLSLTAEQFDQARIQQSSLQYADRRLLATATLRY
jgi:iron complex outermembrane receptor protein